VKKKSALFVGLSGALTLALVLPLLAASVAPIHIPGAAAKTCQQLSDEYGDGATWYELKVTPPATTGTDGTLTVGVTYLNSRSFNWSVASGPGVDAVYVKSGSQGSNLYLYDPASAGDTNLSTPRTQSISHILFCYTGVVNTPPVADAQSVSTAEDTAANITLTGSDVDGDPLTYSIATGPVSGTLSGTAPNVTYTPNPNFNGPDSFTFTVNDGAADSNVATVTITVRPVNDAPVATGPDVSTDEDTPVTIPIDDLGYDPDCLVSESDPDCTGLEVEIIGEPESGTAEVDADGNVVYTPAPDFNGDDSFTYRVCDLSDPTLCSEGEATVSITVDAVNDPPVANDDVAYTDDDTPVTIDVLANDTDVDGDTLSIVSVGDPDKGTAAIVVDPETGQQIQYTPPAGFTGSASFTYTISDGNLTDSATVTVYELFVCGEELTVTEGPVTATYERLFPADGGCDSGKPYELDLTTTDDDETDPIEQLATVVFQPRPQEGDPVEDCSLTPEDCTDEFAAWLTFEPRAKTNGPDTGSLQYDPAVRAEGEPYLFRDMPWCDVDPFAEEVRPPSGEILPEGESWCIVEVSTVIVSPNLTQTTWLVYGIGDPAKRVN
jgi:hypothetical protein